MKDEARTASEPQASVAKHTPGPWRAEGDAQSWTLDGGYGCQWVETPTSHWYANPPVTGSEQAQQMTDARLIAAAPDLLDAAKLACAIAESWIHDQLDGTSSLESALKNLDPVRAAIAKATQP